MATPQQGRGEPIVNGQRNDITSTVPKQEGTMGVRVAGPVPEGVKVGVTSGPVPPPNSVVRPPLRRVPSLVNPSQLAPLGAPRGPPQPPRGPPVFRRIDSRSSINPGLQQQSPSQQGFPYRPQAPQQQGVGFPRPFLQQQQQQPRPAYPGAPTNGPSAGPRPPQSVRPPFNPTSQLLQRQPSAEVIHNPIVSNLIQRMEQKADTKPPGGEKLGSPLPVVKKGDESPLPGRPTTLKETNGSAKRSEIQGASQDMYDFERPVSRVGGTMFEDNKSSSPSPSSENLGKVPDKMAQPSKPSVAAIPPSPQVQNKIEPTKPADSHVDVKAPAETLSGDPKIVQGKQIDAKPESPKISVNNKVPVINPATSQPSSPKPSLPQEQRKEPSVGPPTQDPIAQGIVRAAVNPVTDGQDKSKSVVSDTKSPKSNKGEEDDDDVVVVLSDGEAETNKTVPSSNVNNKTPVSVSNNAVDKRSESPAPTSLPKQTTEEDKKPQSPVQSSPKAPPPLKLGSPRNVASSESSPTNSKFGPITPEKTPTPPKSPFEGTKTPTKMSPLSKSPSPINKPALQQAKPVVNEDPVNSGAKPAKDIGSVGFDKPIGSTSSEKNTPTKTKPINTNIKPVVFESKFAEDLKFEAEAKNKQDLLDESDDKIDSAKGPGNENEDKKSKTVINDTPASPHKPDTTRSDTPTKTDGKPSVTSAKDASLSSNNSPKASPYKLNEGVNGVKEDLTSTKKTSLPQSPTSNPPTSPFNNSSPAKSQSEKSGGSKSRPPSSQSQSSTKSEAAKSPTKSPTKSPIKSPTKSPAPKSSPEKPAWSSSASSTPSKSPTKSPTPKSPANRPPWSSSPSPSKSPTPSKSPKLSISKPSSAKAKSSISPTDENTRLKTPKKSSKDGSMTRNSGDEGDQDSGLDEATKRDERTPNGDVHKSPSKIPAPAKTPVKSPVKSAKSIPPKTPEAAPTSSEKKKLSMNKIQVGAAPSPNLKTVRSKIGSLDNTSYKPGGGKVKIENRKLDFSKANSKIAAKNDAYVPGGGDKKIQQVKLTWNAKPKVGSLDNATHKPGGGDKKIETVKLDFKDKAKPKIGSKDNVKHTPGGGTVKSPLVPQEGNSSSDIESQKVEINAQSKVGSLANVKHKPGGGEVKIFDDKSYLKQVSGGSTATSEGRQSETHNESRRASQGKIKTIPVLESAPSISDGYAVAQSEAKEPISTLPLPDNHLNKASNNEHKQEMITDSGNNKVENTQEGARPGTVAAQVLQLNDGIAAKQRILIPTQSQDTNKNKVETQSVSYHAGCAVSTTDLELIKQQKQKELQKQQQEQQRGTEQREEKEKEQQQKQPRLQQQRRQQGFAQYSPQSVEDASATQNISKKKPTDKCIILMDGDKMTMVQSSESEKIIEGMSVTNYQFVDAPNRPVPNTGTKLTNTSKPADVTTGQAQQSRAINKEEGNQVSYSPAKVQNLTAQQKRTKPTNTQPTNNTQQAASPIARMQKSNLQREKSQGSNDGKTTLDSQNSLEVDKEPVQRKTPSTAMSQSLGKVGSQKSVEGKVMAKANSEVPSRQVILPVLAQPMQSSPTGGLDKKREEKPIIRDVPLPHINEMVSNKRTV